MGGTTLSQKKTFMESSSQNPKPQEVLPPGDADVLATRLVACCSLTLRQHGTQGDKLVIAMVGLPARGKTYIANKLQRYLSFFHGAPTQVFNVGNYRRKMFGSCVEHDFFDHSNPEGVKARRVTLFKLRINQKFD